VIQWFGARLTRSRAETAPTLEEKHIAVKTNPEVVTPVSTNAVKFDGGPYTVEQTADNTSTGAVEYVAPGTTEMSHYGEEVVVNVETPGPVTVTVPGFPVQAKVVTPPVKAEPKTTPAKTKVAQTKAVKAK